MARTQVIAVANQKGGVGKTTTSVNLATAFAAVYKKTLLIDLDPQGNASTGLGIEHNMREKNIYRLIVSDDNVEHYIQKTIIPNLDIIPATVDLSAAEIELIGYNNREYVLKTKFADYFRNYEYVIIDCPPSLGMLTINALTAANSVLIPLQCEFYALEGLSHLLKTISMIRQKLNNSLEIEGVLLTMYDKRNKITEQVEEDVRLCLGGLVYETQIPRNVRVSEAPSHGKPAIIYDMKCSGSVAYLNLVKEILDKAEKKKHHKELEVA